MIVKNSYRKQTASNVLTVVVCLVDTRRSILMRLVTRVCFRDRLRLVHNINSRYMMMIYTPCSLSNHNLMIAFAKLRDRVSFSQLDSGTGYHFLKFDSGTGCHYEFSRGTSPYLVKSSTSPQGLMLLGTV